MRTALRSWLGLVLAVALTGCPSPARPPPTLDSGPGDSGTTPRDTGPPVDTGVLPLDAYRLDMGMGTGACSFGGGCDLLDSMSCPDMGGVRQACYPNAMMGSTMCYPAGAAAAGATCGNLNDCDTGLVCLGSGTCAVACCGNDDCDIGETCQPLGDAAGNPLPNGVGVCNRPTTCTIVPNSCMTDEQCYVIRSDGTTDCLPTGDTAEGMMCAGDCVAGTGCYGPMGGTATCTRFCRLGMAAEDCPAAGATCEDSLGGGVYGLCAGG